MTDSENPIVWSVVDGEAMVLNTHTGDYFSLNETATDIWERLNAGESVNDIVKEVATLYNVNASEVRSDVDDLIENLRASQLWT